MTDFRLETKRRLAEALETIVSAAHDGELFLHELRRQERAPRESSLVDAPDTPTLEEQLAGDVDDRPRLLLVDDNPLLLRAMKRAFGKRFAVHTAANVESALELIDRLNDYDAIVSDFHLPDGQGLRVIAYFAWAYPSSIRVLYTGANVQAPIIKRALQGGLIHVVVEKPEAPATLVDKLLSLVREKQENEE